MACTYQQTEVFRFGNPIVDEWEGKVNAWPLDEGLIDYVDAPPTATAPTRTPLRRQRDRQPKLAIGGKAIDATAIDAGLLLGIAA